MSEKISTCQHVCGDHLKFAFPRTNPSLLRRLTDGRETFSNATQLHCSTFASNPVACLPKAMQGLQRDTELGTKTICICIYIYIYLLYIYIDIGEIIHQNYIS